MSREVWKLPISLAFGVRLGRVPSVSPDQPYMVNGLQDTRRDPVSDFSVTGVWRSLHCIYPGSSGCRSPYCLLKTLPQIQPVFDLLSQTSLKTSFFSDLTIQL
jgi:hypothetical protein